MLLRYFEDDDVYEIEAPDGSRPSLRSHIQVGADAFLDDLLLVPWKGRLVPVPGEILPALARSGMYGLAHRVALPSDSPGSSGAGGQASSRRGGAA